MPAKSLPLCGMGETPFTELWQPPTLASMSPSCAKANNSTSLLAFPRDIVGQDVGQASCQSDGLCVQSAMGPAHTRPAWLPGLGQEAAMQQAQPTEHTRPHRARALRGL